jgi:hypothetical protein
MACITATTARRRSDGSKAAASMLVRKQTDGLRVFNQVETGSDAPRWRDASGRATARRQPLFNAVEVARACQIDFSVGTGGRRRARLRAVPRGWTSTKTGALQTVRSSLSSDVLIQVPDASSYSLAVSFSGFHIAMALAGHAEPNSIDSLALAGTCSLVTTMKPSFPKYDCADVVSK